MSNPTGFDTWVKVQGASVDLAGRTYTVHHQVFANGRINTTLRGPQGGRYYLAAAGRDTDHAEVLSCKGNRPLTTATGAPVLVTATLAGLQEVTR